MHNIIFKYTWSQEWSVSYYTDLRMNNVQESDNTDCARSFWFSSCLKESFTEEMDYPVTLYPTFLFSSCYKYKEICL